MSRFFVYQLIDPRTERVFYVGKGSGNRPAAHTKEAIGGKRSRKCALIRSILADGQAVSVRIVKRFADEAAAYAFEIECIAEIGLANLTNVLAGGQGAMARAVRLAEVMPKVMMTSLAHVIHLYQTRGLRVWWGEMDVTKFAGDTLDRLIAQHGPKKVSERFSLAGASLLTGENNAIC